MSPIERADRLLDVLEREGVLLPLPVVVNPGAPLCADRRTRPSPCSS